MYYNPLKVIGSIQGSGNSNQSPIVSELVPEFNQVGGDLTPGDLWWDPINDYLYIWIDVNDGNGTDWIPIGGSGYIKDIIDDKLSGDYPYN